MQNKEREQMEPIRGSIPLAPTISPEPYCLEKSKCRMDLRCILCWHRHTKNRANLRERTQNTAHESAINPPSEFS
jgi:hypothetical protein